MLALPRSIERLGRKPMLGPKVFINDPTCLKGYHYHGVYQEYALRQKYIIYIYNWHKQIAFIKGICFVPILPKSV